MYKKYIEGKKAVCFDLDGTIVNTTPMHVFAFKQVLEELNPHLFFDDYYGVIGESLTVKWQRVLEAKVLKTDTTLTELVKKTNDKFLKLLQDSKIEVMPGFWELAYFLKEEKQLKIALTTNTDQDTATKILDKIEVNGIFDYSIFGDSVKHSKPHPEIYLKTAKELAIQPQDMLVFEDSLPGAQSADKAGAALMVIWDGQTVQHKFPENTLLFIPDFEGLDTALSRSADEIADDAKKLKAELERQQIQK